MTNNSQKTVLYKFDVFYELDDYTGVPFYGIYQEEKSEGNKSAGFTGDINGCFWNVVYSGTIKQQLSLSAGGNNDHVKFPVSYDCVYYYGYDL